MFSAVLPILQENILTQSKSTTIPRKTKNGNKLTLILNFSLKDKDAVLFKEIQKNILIFGGFSGRFLGDSFLLDCTNNSFTK